MFGAYGELFRSPGAIPLTTAGLLARMPLSMVGIGLITMVAQSGDGFGLAGGLAATYAVSTAVAAPQVSRLVDRLGQRRVIPVAAGISVAALGALLLTSALSGPAWLLFAFAVCAGAAPSAPALVRARWTELHRDSPLLHTAFSWETVLDEVCFIVGPPISIGLSVALFPEAGPLVAGVLLLIGTIWLAAQRRTEPAIGAAARQSLIGALRHRVVWMVALVMVAMGTIAGTIDVVSVAFAQRQGEPAAASVVLSVYALGSCVSGFVFGSRKLARSAERLLALAILATAVMTLPLLLVHSIATLAAAMLVAGVFFAPAMILSGQVVESQVSPRALTEALTWSTAGLGFGVAIGPAAAGPIIDAYGARAAFGVTVAAGAAVAILALVVHRTFRTPARTESLPAQAVPAGCAE
ncbi:MFS transporter [Nocardia mexicana]|uniref:Putative MFS family arabinose efflux permease n=1 Tax=Nocardia mexicana TaxID=279262 RepID=A0A370GNF6_9NOCA|nr:MFS transporter [Nocardia mexicana]RDI44859.1 putative MFS family arabinose efflux permease [Nocardia mexicana]